MTSQNKTSDSKPDVLALVAKNTRLKHELAQAILERDILRIEKGKNQAMMKEYEEGAQRKKEKTEHPRSLANWLMGQLNIQNAESDVVFNLAEQNSELRMHITSFRAEIATLQRLRTEDATQMASLQGDVHLLGLKVESFENQIGASKKGALCVRQMVYAFVSKLARACDNRYAEKGRAHGVSMDQLIGMIENNPAFQQKVASLQLVAQNGVPWYEDTVLLMDLRKMIAGGVGLAHPDTLKEIDIVAMEEDMTEDQQQVSKQLLPWLKILTKALGTNEGLLKR